MVTHLRLFNLVFMRFGIFSASSWFQKVVAQIFDAISGVIKLVKQYRRHRVTVKEHDRSSMMFNDKLKKRCAKQGEVSIRR